MKTLPESSTTEPSGEEEAEKVQLHIRIDRYLLDFMRDWAQAEQTTVSDLLRKHIRDEYERRIIRGEMEDVGQF